LPPRWLFWSRGAYSLVSRHTHFTNLRGGIIRWLYHGLGVGLGFFILMWVLGTLFFTGPMTVIGLLEKLILTGSAGALGGIAGVSFGD